MQASCASFVSGEVKDCQSFTQMALRAGLWNQLCPSSSLFNDYFKLVSKLFVSMTSWLAFIHISLLSCQILLFFMVGCSFSFHTIPYVYFKFYFTVDRDEGIL